MNVDHESAITSGLHNYLQPVALPFELPTRLYGCMLAIWLLRPYLQRRFPLHKQRAPDYIRFLAWCTTVGRREYAILRNLEAWNAELAQPMDLPVLKADRWSGSYTVGMYLIGVARSRYWLAPMMTSHVVRRLVVRWFWRHGQHALSLTSVPAWQAIQLRHRFASPTAFFQSLLTRQQNNTPGMLEQLQQQNPELIKQWELENCIAVPSVAPPTASFWSTLSARCAPRYLKEVLVLGELFLRKPAQQAVTQILSRVGLQRTAQEESALRSPFGVNLIGYAHGELGIGEDVRMLAHSLRDADVPFCIVNVQPGSDVSQADRSAHCWIVDAPIYSINIFCMTGVEQVRIVCEKGTDVLLGRYTIGLWPWELPRWPECWHHAWNTVNEIWGISEYAAAAYQAAPLPVRPMPLPVKLGPVEDKRRDDFKLPGASYLFVFSFDLNSTLSRKNPQAIISAFQAAFPCDGTAQVGLVIKVNHPRDKDRDWQAFKRLLHGDARIHLIEGAMRRQDVLALYQCCNCFVSLHRAEGFGRGIAEAQLLGMEVITTGFSGNTDFCAQGATEQVSYQLRPLRADEYYCGEGQHWAEPDIHHAATLMKKVYGRHQAPGSVLHITERFSTAHCGQIYRQRLEQIHTMISVKGVEVC